MNTAIKEFKLRNHTITLKVSEGRLFTLNAVTGLFAKVVDINPESIVFDIGSGVGPLAIWAAKESSKKVYAVEIVKAQYTVLQENIKDNNLAHKITAYHGEFFKPIPPEVKADVIIADVSGIAEGPARALGWYPPEIPTGGEDGTETIIPLLEQAGNYLAPGGRVYFPIAIDLSDSKKIMNIAEAKFGNLELMVNPDFPLTEQQVSSLKPFESPYVNIRKRGSRHIWRGAIYKATDPK